MNKDISAILIKNGVNTRHICIYGYYKYNVYLKMIHMQRNKAHWMMPTVVHNV